MHFSHYLFCKNRAIVEQPKIRICAVFEVVTLYTAHTGDLPASWLVVRLALLEANTAASARSLLKRNNMYFSTYGLKSGFLRRTGAEGF